MITFTFKASFAESAQSLTRSWTVVPLYAWSAFAHPDGLIFSLPNCLLSSTNFFVCTTCVIELVWRSTAFEWTVARLVTTCGAPEFARPSPARALRRLWWRQVNDTTAPQNMTRDDDKATHTRASATCCCCVVTCDYPKIEHLTHSPPKFEYYSVTICWTGWKIRKDTARMVVFIIPLLHCIPSSSCFAHAFFLFNGGSALLNSFFSLDLLGRMSYKYTREYNLG